MRHRKGFNHLSRKSSHRKAMLANMASSLILHKRIKTTTAKAKALRMYVEPLITKSKDDSTHSRRTVFSYLQNKDAVSELFREVSPKIMERPGGYTRILKTGNRLGDNAEMCIIELVDYNENLLATKDESVAKSGRRRRRGGKKKPSEAQAQPEASAEEAIETEEVNTEEPEGNAAKETTAAQSTDTENEAEETAVKDEKAKGKEEVQTSEEEVVEKDSTEKQDEKTEETVKASDAETTADESAENKETEETKEDTEDRADSSESEEKKE